MVGGVKDSAWVGRTGYFWGSGNRHREGRRWGICVQALNMSQQCVAQQGQLLAVNSSCLTLFFSASQLSASLWQFSSSKAGQRTIFPFGES